jgi:hypothetical protein
VSDSFTNNNFGKQNNQFGAGSHMTVNESAGPGSSAEATAAVRELITHARDLRSQVSPVDREDIDASLQVMEDGDAEPGGIRRALRNLETIARTAGSVGLPVLNAMVAVKQLLGV